MKIHPCIIYQAEQYIWNVVLLKQYLHLAIHLHREIVGSQHNISGILLWIAAQYTKGSSILKGTRIVG